MKKTLRYRIAALATMNVPALREEYRRVFGKDPVSAHRQFLFRKFAWRLQADGEGRLPMPGGWIMKQYRGGTHIVRMIDDGRFSHDDRQFKSLSPLAQEITGNGALPACRAGAACVNS